MIHPMERVKVNPHPDPERIHPKNNMQMLHLDTRDGNEPSGGLKVPSGSNMTHSPSIKSNIHIPQRKCSASDSLNKMEIPVFTKSEMKKTKKGPSSPTTVLAMSGLFVCGLLMMISGLLVLVQQSGDVPFEITGSIFLSGGFIMLLTCLVLQRKNLVKYILDLNRDLYFLNMGESPMWKFMFEDRAHELPSPN